MIMRNSDESLPHTTRKRWKPTDYFCFLLHAALINILSCSLDLQKNIKVLAVKETVSFLQRIIAIEISQTLRSMNPTDFCGAISSPFYL